jgi:hypothetical protein
MKYKYQITFKMRYKSDLNERKIKTEMLLSSNRKTFKIMHFAWIFPEFVDSWAYIMIVNFPGITFIIQNNEWRINVIFERLPS